MIIKNLKFKLWVMLAFMSLIISSCGTIGSTPPTPSDNRGRGNGGGNGGGLFVQYPNIQPLFSATNPINTGPLSTLENSSQIRFTDNTNGTIAGFRFNELGRPHIGYYFSNNENDLLLSQSVDVRRLEVNESVRIGNQTYTIRKRGGGFRSGVRSLERDINPNDELRSFSFEVSGPIASHIPNGSFQYEGDVSVDGRFRDAYKILGKPLPIGPGRHISFGTDNFPYYSDGSAPDFVLNVNFDNSTGVFRNQILHHYNTLQPLLGSTGACWIGVNNGCSQAATNLNLTNITLAGPIKIDLKNGTYFGNDVKLIQKNSSNNLNFDEYLNTPIYGAFHNEGATGITGIFYDSDNLEVVGSIIGERVETR